MDRKIDRYLVINADDFGLLPEVNRGIIECFHAGSITSATLMVNTDGTSEAVSLARECPELGVGFHFNLTQGKPIADPEIIPTLVGTNGRFHPRHEFEKKAVTGKIDGRDVEKEFIEQMKTFRNYALNATHIDSHHHIHLFPAVFKVLCAHAKGYNLPLRIPRVDFSFIRPCFDIGALKSLIRKLLLAALIIRNSVHRIAGVTTPAKFLSIYDYIPLPAKIRADHYFNLLTAAAPGITEVMVHPAYVTDKLNRMFSGAHIKEQELEALRSFSYKDAAQKKQFRVVSYREVC